MCWVIKMTDEKKIISYSHEAVRSKEDSTSSMFAKDLEDLKINMDGLVVGDKGGKKCDKGKVELSLLFDAPDALEVIARIQEFGKNKYGRTNWRTLDVQRHKDALLRHFNAISRGEDWDDGEGGTGQLHWGNICCNAIFILQIIIDKMNNYEFKTE